MGTDKLTYSQTYKLRNKQMSGLNTLSYRHNRYPDSTLHSSPFILTTPEMRIVASTASMASMLEEPTRENEEPIFI